MKLNKFLITVAISASVATAAHAQTNIFVEDFSSSSYSPGESLLNGGDQSTLQNYSANIVAVGTDGGQALQFGADFTQQNSGSLMAGIYEAAGQPNWTGVNASQNLADYTLNFDMAIGGIALNAVHVDLQGLDTGTDSGDMAIDTSAIAPNSGYQAVSINLGSFADSQLDPSSQQLWLSFSVEGADLAGGGPVTGETVGIDNISLVEGVQAVPEPGTVALCCAGVGIIIVNRKTLALRK
jgi:hypothetical protein